MARNYRKNVLLVFDDFDPVDNYVLGLVEEAKKIVSFDVIVFSYHPFKPKEERVFLKDEKVVFLSSIIPHSPTPMHVIYGDSFSSEKMTISQKINANGKIYQGANLYILLDSKKFKFLVEGNDWPVIVSKTQMIFYKLPEHQDVVDTYYFTAQYILFINSKKEINEIKNASIYEVSEKAFNPTIVNIMNKADICAFKRVQKHLSDERFQHSVRVAKTINKICELSKEEDEEFQYNAYLSAIYHDICKEMPVDQQKQIAETILGIEEYPSWKVLHGPIASWYLRKKYLFDNVDVLEAITHHTIPNENPKKITMFLYLADRLEPGKKDRYPPEVYDQTWNLISEEKIENAFYYLLDWVNSKRNK